LMQQLVNAIKTFGAIHTPPGKVASKDLARLLRALADVHVPL
jgi:hypothetical protein